MTKRLVSSEPNCIETWWNDLELHLPGIVRIVYDLLVNVVNIRYDMLCICLLKRTYDQINKTKNRKKTVDVLYICIIYDDLPRDIAI